MADCRAFRRRAGAATVAEAPAPAPAAGRTMRRLRVRSARNHGSNAWSIEEVGFQPADQPRRVIWNPREMRLVFSPWRIYSEGEILIGSEVPEPSTGRTTALGEQTRAVAIAHWPLALLLSVPVMWWWTLGLRRRT